MALKKVNYVSGKTVITAENLNDIQDSVLALESEDGGGSGLTATQIAALDGLLKNAAYTKDVTT